MPFKKSKPKAGRVVRVKAANGTTKEYRYPAYPRKQEQKAGPDTVAALSSAWRRSPEWERLAERTKVMYFRYVRDLERIGAVQVSQVRRRDILAIRDAIAAARGPASAQAFVRTASSVFSWAVEREWLETSPCHRLKALPGGTFPTWTEEEVAHALAHLPEHLRRVVVLAVHTVQRRADLCALTWFQVQGGVIRLTQQKTARPLVLAIHPELARELAVWRAENGEGPILRNASGEPWKPQWLSEAMQRALKVLGMRPGLNIHGLRKRGATRVAEAGGSAHEIAAVTGHTTLSMVQHYTKAAEQEKLAQAAVTRLVTYKSDKTSRRR